MSVFIGGPYGTLAVMLKTLSSLNIEIIIIIIITRSYTNRAAKPQNMSRCMKFQIYEEEGLYYLCSGYHKADLCLCYRVCKKPVFSQPGSYGPLESYLWGSGHDLTQTGLYVASWPEACFFRYTCMK